MLRLADLRSQQNTPIDRESAGAGRRCAQWAIRKPAGGRCPTGISRMASTRACEGPDRRAWTNSSTRFGGPATRTSTLRSGRFRTVPRRPSAAAVLRAHQRNPTPWTRPMRTKALRVSAPEGGKGPSFGLTVGRRRRGVSGWPPRGSSVRAKGKRSIGVSHARLRETEGGRHIRGQACGVRGRERLGPAGSPYAAGYGLPRARGSDVVQPGDRRDREGNGGARSGCPGRPDGACDGSQHAALPDAQRIQGAGRVGTPRSV